MMWHDVVHAADASNAAECAYYLPSFCGFSEDTGRKHEVMGVNTHVPRQKLGQET